MSGKSLLVNAGHAQDVLATAHSPAGARIATGSADGTGRSSGTRTTGQKQFTTEHGQVVRAVAFSPDSSPTRASGGDDHNARIWDMHGKRGSCRWRIAPAQCAASTSPPTERASSSLAAMAPPASLWPA